MSSSTKRRRRRRTENMNDEDIALAIRRRMQAQALYDRIGKGIEPVIAYRFAEAAGWDRLAPTGLPSGTAEIIRNDKHPRRYQVPPGPIITVHDGGGLVIVEPRALFLRPEREVRSAVLSFFEAAKDVDRPWLTPFVLQLLSENRQQVLSTK